jgi:Tfp pilus assembly protein PilO
MAEEFKISDWLQQSKEDPKKAAPPLIIILGIVFVVWKFVYSPKSILIDKEQKKNKRLAGEMKNFKNAANQLEDIKLDIEEKKKKWEENQKLCYKELERTVFLRRVREIATQAGINVKSINPTPDENIKISVIDAKKFSVQFSYTGDLTHLLTFMRLIELEPKITFMPIPNLMPNASGTLDTQITVSTILLPDKISTDIQTSTDDEDEEEEE